MSELDQVTLTAGDKSVAMPVIKPTLGNDCVDISKLPKETGLFTYDPGFTATAGCKSAITYIDGDAGVLLYRGYPIEQLAKQSSFLEVAYLLMNGELPTQSEFAAFDHEVTHHTMMHEALKNFLGGFRHDAHPMAMLCGMVASLAAFYHDTLDLERSGAAPPGRDPPDRQGADDRRRRLSLFDRLAGALSAQQPRIRRPLPAHDVRSAERAAGAEPGGRPRRWTCCSSCTPTTSRTPRPRPCAWSAPPARIRTPASPPASPRCGARRMAAPTKRC